ncbi:MAG: competence/damage-inducible protein A [Nitrospirota bacterium]
MRQTAGIIIIGDEILSGMVQDTNSLFMVRALRQMGIEVRRISVIRDEVDEIAQEAKAFSDKFDYVFTSGGIGPTHDDVTIEGIARAFGVPVVIDRDLRAFLEKHYGSDLTPAQLRMAEIPEGASVIKDESIGLPLIRFRNIYILPGIPKYLEGKFSVISKLLFGEKPPLFKRIYVAEYETKIAPLLNEIVKCHQEVKIGSYPVVDRKDYSVMITMESYNEAQLESAFRQLVDGLPSEKILKIED